MLCRRSAGLQRDDRRPEVHARQLVGGVVDAGEARHANEITGTQGILVVMMPSAAIAWIRDHRSPSLMVSNRGRKCSEARPAGRVGDHFAGSLSQRGTAADLVITVAMASAIRDPG